MKYITQPANVNAHSLDTIIAMYIQASVKEATRALRSTNPGPKVRVLNLHQKIPQADGWEKFLSNGDNKNNLLTFFVRFLKSLYTEEYRK